LGKFSLARWFALEKLVGEYVAESTAQSFKRFVGDIMNELTNL